uniref:Uncharacterized protein n=1 Tax=viral metagenome TaxID=1070528 RepID=A0A6M3M345_9ZZZZ
MSNNIQPNPATKLDQTTAMSALGILTSACECKTNSDDKAKCHSIIEPLEKGTKNAVDVMTEMILEIGPDEFNKTIENLDLIINAATQQAKTRLVELGKIDQDGNPI